MQVEANPEDVESQFLIKLEGTDPDFKSAIFDYVSGIAFRTELEIRLMGGQCWQNINRHDFKVVGGTEKILRELRARDASIEQTKIYRSSSGNIEFYPGYVVTFS